jgi:hypothetical protein
MPEPIILSPTKIGDLRPSVVAHFTRRSVSFTRMVLLPLALTMKRITPKNTLAAMSIACTTRSPAATA